MQFAITPQVENTFIYTDALSFDVQSRYVHPFDLVFQWPVLLCPATFFPCPSMSIPANSVHPTKHLGRLN